MNLLPTSVKDWMIVTSVFALFQIVGNLYFLQFDTGYGVYTRATSVGANAAVLFLGIYFLRTGKGQEVLVSLWRLIILFHAFVCYGVTDPQSKFSMVFIMVGGIMFIEEFASKKSIITLITVIAIILAFLLPTTYVLHDVEPYSKLNFYFILPLIFILFNTQINRRLKLERLLTQEQNSSKWLNNMLGLAVHNFRTPLTKINLLLELARNKNEEFIPLDSIEQSYESLLSNTNLILVAQQGAKESDLTLKSIVNKLILPEKTSIDIDYKLLETKIKSEEFLAIFMTLDNLLSNAAKHKNTKILFRLTSLNGRIGFIVEDDGPGFPKELFSKMNTSTRTTLNQKSKKGMGVGLSLSAEALIQVNWELRLFDQEEQGTKMGLFKI